MQFKNTIIKALNLKEDQYREDLALGDVPTWDSVGHLGLIFEIEATYGTAFDVERIPELKNLQLIREALASKGVAC